MSWALPRSRTRRHHDRFSTFSNAPWTTQVPTRNISSATRASSSGVTLFKDWCDRQGITPRFGAVGQHGSIALIERFILTLKNECMRIILVPLRTDAFHQELMCFTYWYNQSRPHSSLNGRTPHEVYHDVLPACERPRLRTAREMAAQCAMRIAARTGRRPLWHSHSP